MPRDLLAPEIAVLLDYLPDLRQRMLIETLWNTGARINEALALTPGDVFFNSDLPFVRLRTLKQHAPRPRRRLTKEEQQRREAPFRAVPLPDAGYVRRLQGYFATFKLLTRRATPMWDVASQETPRNWLRAAVRPGWRDFFGAPHHAAHVLPQLCDASAVNDVLVKQVQALMGHKRLENTEIYTRIFALDLTPDLAFSLPVDEARGLPALPSLR